MKTFYSYIKHSYCFDKIILFVSISLPLTITYSIPDKMGSFWMFKPRRMSNVEAALFH